MLLQCLDGPSSSVVSALSWFPSWLYMHLATLIRAFNPPPL